MNGHTNGAPTEAWSPTSWRSKPIKQEVVYSDESAVNKAITKLNRVPPIVTPHEIWKLRTSLRDVALGKAFLLQGGDCAELFDYCNAEAIDSKIKLLLQMSLVLVYGAHLPVVRIARMAGQYAKPRSSPTEVIDGKTLPSFRGDILNDYHPDNRDIDPDRLVQAYFHSAATLNYVRAQLGSGIADLHKPLDWNLGHVGDPDLQAKYAKIVDSISESLRFMNTVGVTTGPQLQSVDLYTSHEGLLLEYETGLTRHLKHPTNRFSTTSQDKTLRRIDTENTSGYYNTSAHFLWIGDRTRQPTHAHVEYFRGIENPIGIKVGPTTSCEDLVQLLDVVNPNKEIGKVTLITRYGEGRVEELLPGHIEAVKKSGHVVVWQCDPMHGYVFSPPFLTCTNTFLDPCPPYTNRYISSPLGTWIC